MDKPNVHEFRKILRTICARDTSADPGGWTPENPLWGHCAVVALLAQDMFGGKLIRVDLTHVPKFAHMRSHYLNDLGSGQGEDFTAAQFGPQYLPHELKSETRERSYVLSYPETMERYQLLALRFFVTLGQGNEIFNDRIYQKCVYAALGSTCQKMRFGCVITHDGKVVYAGSNGTIGPLKSMCEPTCMRFAIQSRTESMLGACAHAEEGMWEVIHKGIPIHECELYVAGLNPLPWLKDAPVHTCLRCAVQMYHARLRKIYVPVIDRWVGLSP